MTESDAITLPGSAYLGDWPQRRLGPAEVDDIVAWETRLSTARAYLVAFFAVFPGADATENLANYWEFNFTTIANVRSDLGFRDEDDGEDDDGDGEDDDGEDEEANTSSTDELDASDPW